MCPSKGPGLQIRVRIGKLFSLFLTQNMFYVLGTQKNRLIAQPLSYLRCFLLLRSFKNVEFISIFVELTSSKK